MIIRQKMTNEQTKRQTDYRHV